MKSENHPESINVPEPVIRWLSQNLKLTKTRWVLPQKLAEEDPTFALKQTLKLVKQLSLVWVSFTLTSLLTMCREFKVEANVGAPQVSYQKHLRSYSSTWILQTSSGGKGQFGDVWIELTPNEEGKGFGIRNAIVGGGSEFIPAVEKVW